MIVAVAGGKGGVGKSTVSLNLAHELDAVVVDADLTGADLPPGTGPDLHDVLAGRANPVDAVETSGSVPVLPCGRTLSGARASEIAALERVLERVERGWGRVVVDCPSGLARDVGFELRAADLAVLVTSPDKAALVDALRTHDLAVTLETPVAAVVLNMADREGHGSLAGRLGRTLGVDVTLVERQDAVADAQARWVPVHDHDADAQALEAYHSVAERVGQAQTRCADRSDSV
ncbi:MinD/ParA family ATP-binding protein [Natrinema longum]|uniref:P-loop NTPase n=1 Tax=Natrinema longum TaxID=370324 RepID=A0A8A2U8Q5_9EURY|nr:P-loop NTPase [Natrinema longum]MBZ6493610.1 P-loop NTPase [Natrinema longum]QSW85047.1 P-loop NTPase [Natrinema longum]